ncbi:uncharacterized protein LOC106868184 [Octopus bimaculoides]|uniref:uncharacterized protein LOC106868184 n=1 Tax=Octopus bimaculoides TaxID=37653 RepID=UPI0022E116E0|nr:uncharacterized protein LOC106868184 [Octopus bimaculoides]
MGKPVPEVLQGKELPSFGHYLTERKRKLVEYYKDIDLLSPKNEPPKIRPPNIPSTSVQGVQVGAIFLAKESLSSSLVSVLYISKNYFHFRVQALPISSSLFFSLALTK